MPEESTPATESAATPGLAEPTGSAEPAAPDTGYTASGVPTLEGVRDKIESRYGAALGATELAAETPEVRTAAEQYEARQQAAADKLAEIRRSMAGGDAQPAGSGTAGTP